MTLPAGFVRKVAPGTGSLILSVILPDFVPAQPLVRGLLALLGLVLLAVELIPARPPAPAEATSPPRTSVFAVINAGLVRKEFADRQEQREWTATIAVVGCAVSRVVRMVPHLRFDGEGRREEHAIGRWGDAPLPEHRDRAVEAIEIRPGEIRVLDIAAWHDDEPGWYPLTTTSPFHGYRGPLAPFRGVVVVTVDFILEDGTNERVILQLRESDTDGRLAFTLLGPSKVVLPRT